jgi:hypothetical protein
MAGNDPTHITAHSKPGLGLPDITCALYVFSPRLTSNKITASANVVCTSDLPDIILDETLYIEPGVAIGHNRKEQLNTGGNTVIVSTAIQGPRCKPRAKYLNSANATLRWPSGYEAGTPTGLYDDKYLTLEPGTCVVAVPNLYGTDVQVAAATLDAAGLVAQQGGTITDPSCTEEFDEVGFQLPAAGTEVADGTTVRFSTWSYPPRCPINDL